MDFSNYYRKTLLIIAAVMLLNSAVRADPVQIIITGKVIAAACTVDAGLVSGQAVNLGTLGRTRLQSAGNAGAWQSFSLSLSNCPPGTLQATAAFTGSPDGNDATLFANTEPGATAAVNVAVQMVNGGNHNTVLSNNSTMTVSVDTASHSAVFPLAARLYTPVGGAGAGSVTSTVLVNFTYQ